MIANATNINVSANIHCYICRSGKYWQRFVIRMRLGKTNFDTLPERHEDHSHSKTAHYDDNDDDDEEQILIEEMRARPAHTHTPSVEWLRQRAFGTAQIV